jgi:hypothetical protein
MHADLLAKLNEIKFNFHPETPGGIVLSQLLEMILEIEEHGFCERSDEDLNDAAEALLRAYRSRRPPTAADTATPASTIAKLTPRQPLPLDLQNLDRALGHKPNTGISNGVFLLNRPAEKSANKGGIYVRSAIFEKGKKRRYYGRYANGVFWPEDATTQTLELLKAYDQEVAARGANVLQFRASPQR